MQIKLKTFLLIVSPLLLVVAAAYVQWGTVGLPALPTSPTMIPETAAEPYGFPAWLRITHYVNFLFLVLLVRSGLQILVDHPRLYWNVHCTPGTEWLRLTPVEVPKDRLWTAKDDSRYLSPWIGLPGYRHTIGMARHWHFLSVLFWVGNGVVFVVLLFATDQWKRLVPNSWQIVPDAWAVFVHYATFHLPPEPNGFYHYNALQQLAYFGVVFVLAPLAILTGPSMSPALTNRFKWYPKLPGNRQIGRSLHFLVMCAFVIFLVGHVTMVAITGFVRNMNHIVVGTDDTSLTGVYLGLVGVGVIVAVNALANWLAWRRPRLVQHVAKAIVTPVMSFLLDRAAPQAEFRREDISPFLWANGKVPTCEEWKTLAADNFKDYRLKVYGLVENPVELSLDDLRALGKKDADHAAPLHPGLVGHRRVGRAAAGGADSTGPAETRCKSGRLLLVRRGRRAPRGRRGRSILRQPLDRERSEPSNIAGVRDELPAAQSSARSAVAVACRESTRLQDGQVDPGDRVRRGRPVDRQG